MPAYSTASGPTLCQPGDTMTMFGSLVAGVLTGELPTAPANSLALGRGLGPTNVPAGIVFQIQAPSGTVLILGSNIDSPAQWALAAGNPLYTSSGSEADEFYADDGNFLFYLAQLATGTGPVTVIAQR